MADSGLFIGWGEVVRGREEKAIQVFNESVQYYGGLQQEGRIESFDVCLLEPHGGEGEAEDGPPGGACRGGGGADPRRLRLHRGVPRLPLLPRREDPHHRRGHR